jgi:hypothetical protein
MRENLRIIGGSVMLHDMAYGGTQGTELFTNVSLEMLPISSDGRFNILVVNLPVAISPPTIRLQRLQTLPGLLRLCYPRRLPTNMGLRQLHTNDLRVSHLQRHAHPPSRRVRGLQFRALWYLGIHARYRRHVDPITTQCRLVQRVSKRHDSLNE